MSNYNSQLQSNNTDLQTVLQTLQTKAAGGEQATPVISVNNSNGLITATAGTKTSTHQLAFQPAKTITPVTVNQTAVSSGCYTGGAVTVKGDSNLVAGNIKSGVNIFGVTGTYAGSGGGDTSVEDSLITRNLSSYTNSRVTSIGSYAFYSCSKLTSVSFPAATTIGNSAFCNCSNLTTISFPVATSIGRYAFGSCSKLTTISFPSATSIVAYAFANCSSLTSISLPKAKIIANGTFQDCISLTSASFPAVTSISNYAFNSCYRLASVNLPAAISIGFYAFSKCYNLIKLYLTGSSLCKLDASNAFSSTPIGGYSTSAGTYGSIYVPASLLASYKAATNWAYFSSRFVAYDGGANMIAFTIDGTEYQAEEGMTWGEWCDSEYNTDGFYFESYGPGFIYDVNDFQVATGIKLVDKDALINDGGSYNLV